MIIQISDYMGNPLTVMTDFLDLQFDKKLSDDGGCSFSLGYDTCTIQGQWIKLWNKIQIIYNDTEAEKSYIVRTGVIFDVKVQESNIQVMGIDMLGLMKYRITRSGMSFAQQPINTTIQSIYTTLNTIYPLPISLGINNNIAQMALDFEAGLNFFDIIKKIADKSGEFRVVGDVLDIGVDIGSVLGGVRQYNYLSPTTSNINSRLWQITGDVFWNTLVSKDSNALQTIKVTTDSVSLSNNPLIEKFQANEDGHSEQTRGDDVKFPSIDIDASCEQWRDIQVGDRKQVSLHTYFDALSIDFVGVIQSISVKSNGGKYDISVKVSQDTKYLPKDIGTLFRDISKRLNSLEVYS